jgi:hypothetical protein
MSNGNDMSLSSTHDSDDPGLWSTELENNTLTVPAHPQPLRLHAPLRRQSDPHLVMQDSRGFRASSSSEDGPLLTYASLPPTPITSSPPPTAPKGGEYKLPAQEQSDVYNNPFSLWDYLREELLATDFDSHQELKWERVSNFLSIPLAIEKVGVLACAYYGRLSDSPFKIISFGFILCFDSFLYTFTIQPIRFALALWRLFINVVTNSKAPLPPSQKADILRTLLLTLSIIILIPLADASKIYHSIRGQDTIKLYVIFNALEVGNSPIPFIGF